MRIIRGYRIRAYPNGARWRWLERFGEDRAAPVQPAVSSEWQSRGIR